MFPASLQQCVEIIKSMETVIIQAFFGFSGSLQNGDIPRGKDS